jgi:hypothetical protein
MSAERIFKSQNLLEFCIHYRGVQKLEATRMFTKIAFQRCLIDLHALFSPSKMNGPLKFEPLIDQISKGSIVADKEYKLALFRRSFPINL